MKLISVTLENFKGLAALKFDKFEQSGLTVIQGNNGSGKTTLLDALAFVMNGSPEFFGVEQFSKLVKLGEPGCKVTMQVRLDNGDVMTLRKECFGNNTWCFNDDNRIPIEEYTNSIKGLNIKRDYEFVPILTNHINKFSESPSEQADYFDKISGASRLYLEDQKNKENIRRVSKSLKEMEEQQSFMEFEKLKTTNLFMAKLYLFDMLIKTKTREIALEKEEQMRLRITAGGSTVNLGKSHKEAQLEQELNSLRSEKFYYLRKCEANQIRLPGLDENRSVLTREERNALKNQQTSEKDLEKVLEKKRFTPKQIEKGEQMHIDFTEFKIQNPSLIDEQSIKMFCDLNQFDLKTCQSRKSKTGSPLMQKLSACNKQIEKKEKQIEHYKDCSFDFQHQRRDSFNQFFDFVARRINKEYKAIWADKNRKASLKVENEEKPWEKVKFVLHNGGKETNFEDLDGGEQKMAQIALFFAMVSATNSPVAVIDDVDKYIGEQAFPKIIQYLVKKCESCQVVVTGSNTIFFEFISMHNISVMHL